MGVCVRSRKSLSSPQDLGCLFSGTELQVSAESLPVRHARGTWGRGSPVTRFLQGGDTVTPQWDFPSGYLTGQIEASSSPCPLCCVR